MNTRKQNPDRADVPNVLVAGVMIVLLVIFVPLVRTTPDLPSGLPPVTYDAAAVERASREPVRRVIPPFVLHAFRDLSDAVATRNTRTMGGLQREFAAFLVDFAGDDLAARRDARRAMLQEFLRAVHAGTDHPLMRVARRHRLAGDDVPVHVNDAMLIAWFDLRWENLGAREAARGETVPLERLLERVPETERRALCAWVLMSDCDAVLGVPPGAGLTGAQIESCAAVRREFVGVASELDASYPTLEARAATEVLRARAYANLANMITDESLRGEARTASHEAFDRASGFYTQALAREGSRRLRRYHAGTLRAGAE